MKAFQNLQDSKAHLQESQREDQWTESRHFEGITAANQSSRKPRYERDVASINSGLAVTDFSVWCDEIQKGQQQPALGFQNIIGTADDNKGTNERYTHKKLIAETPKLRRTARFATIEPSDASLLGEPGPAISALPSLPLRKAESERNLRSTASRDVARALAKTMLGDWLVKDSHDPKFWDLRNVIELAHPTPSYGNLKPAGLSRPGTRQKRWFWLAPLERKIFWQRSSLLPTSYGFRGEESSMRHIPIVAVFEASISSHEANFNCGSDKQFYERPRAIMVAGPRRMIRLTTTDKNTHDTWLLALRYIASASTNDIEDSVWKKTIQHQLNILQPFDFLGANEVSSNTVPNNNNVRFFDARSERISLRDAITAPARLPNEANLRLEKPLPVTPRLSSPFQAREKPQSSPVPANVRHRRQKLTLDSNTANEASTMIENTVPWSTPKTPKELRRGRKSTRIIPSNPSFKADNSKKEDISPTPPTTMATRSVSARSSSFPPNKDVTTAPPTSSGAPSDVPLTTGLDDYLLVFEKMFRGRASRTQSSTRSHFRYAESESDSGLVPAKVSLP